MTSPLRLIAGRCREIDLGRIASPRPTGVYFLVDGDEIVYVGQTADLEVRIAMHLEAGLKRFDRAFWIELPADQLDAHEGAFIRALNPRYCLAAPADVGTDGAVLAAYGLTVDPEARFEGRRRHWRRGDRAVGRQKASAS